MNDLVLDASATVEICIRSELGARIEEAAPMRTTWWAPDGIFDVEVHATLRRLEMRQQISSEQCRAARLRLGQLRLRRRRVVDLADLAWSMRASITFSDACYVALAQALACALLTTDMKLVRAPGLPVPTIHP